MDFIKLQKAASISLVIFIALMVFAPSSVDAQTADEEELYDGLKDHFKKEYLSFSMLLQAHGAIYPENSAAQNSYSIATARFGVSGNLDRGVSYKVLTDFNKQQVLLDMSASFNLSDYLSITAGAQKTGVSGGYLLAASSTDFLSRPRISSFLAGNRDIGLLTKIDLSDNFLLSAGMFNGTNQNLTNNNDKFYYTSRLQWNQSTGDGNLQVGVNGAFGNEDGTSIGNGTLPDVNGDRLLAGVDFRYTNNKILASGEFLYGELDYNTATTDQVKGYHLTGGYNFYPSVQVLVRYDHVESEVVNLAEDILTFGLSHEFTQTTGFSLNYQMNPDDTSDQRIMAEIQLAF